MSKPNRRPRREGSIRYDAARGRYEIRVRPGVGLPARSYYIARPESPAGARAADDLRIAKVAEARAGVRPIGRSLTVGSWLDQWLTLKAQARPSTLAAYTERIDLYLKPELGRIRLADLDETHVSRALDRLAERPGRRVERLSPSTVDACYRVLSAALNDAVRSRKIAWNPASIVTSSPAHVEIVPPTLDELDRVFAVLRETDPVIYPLLKVLRWTGAREAEITGLRRPDVDLDTGILTIVRQGSGARLKTKSSRRSLPLPDRVIGTLGQLPRRIDTDLLFPSDAGTLLDRSNVLRRWRRACELAEIAPPAGSDLDHYRVHDLRHAFATMLLQAGAGPLIVSHWLGHSSTAMLDRYAHVRPIPGGAAYRAVTAAWGSETHSILGMPELRTAVG